MTGIIFDDAIFWFQKRHQLLCHSLGVILLFMIFFGVLNKCVVIFKDLKNELWEILLCSCRFIQHPKNFGLIASFLERKVMIQFFSSVSVLRSPPVDSVNYDLKLNSVLFQTVAECVLFYYLTKKNENYKNIVRRNYRRRGRSQVHSPFKSSPHNALL